MSWTGQPTLPARAWTETETFALSPSGLPPRSVGPHHSMMELGTLLAILTALRASMWRTCVDGKQRVPSAIQVFARSVGMVA
eukprot:scaffold162_cov474-Prasinococcus_capsulatus_cf.AAC.3